MIRRLDLRYEAMFRHVRALTIRRSVLTFARGGLKDSLRVRRLLPGRKKLRRNDRRFPFHERDRLISGHDFLARHRVITSLTIRPGRRYRLHKIARPFQLLTDRLFFRGDDEIDASAFRCRLTRIVVPRLPIVLRAVRVKFVRLRRVLNRYANLINAGRYGNSRHLTYVRLTRRIINKRRTARVRHRARYRTRQRTFKRDRRGRNGHRRGMLRDDLRNQRPVARNVG